MGEKHKIGQEIIFKAHECKTFGGNVKTVKDGDKGIVKSDGFVLYLTGEARGIIAKTDFEVKGYDTKNIADMITHRLIRSYGIDNFLDDEEIELQEFKEEIEDILSDIL